ncbi:MAG: MotA/TolQ/ExbB proton channel family protein [Oscillospiraceae bacterium]|nr:MotA/TolQ/ExbB proton channel family protein [Oscillospiraceae bacterium]
MNITLIIGWVLSFGLVVFGIVFDTKKGINFGAMSNFIEIQSLAITVGGTIGCLVASFPMSYLKNLGKRIGIAFKPKKYDPKKYIEQIVEYAQVARSKGLLALEESANQCTDPFMKSALMMIVDANDPEKVRGMLDDTIMFMCERHEQGRAFFEKGVSIFPAFGMLGTLVGLINMLASLDLSNPQALTSGMATALITTFYGSLFANVVFAPLGMALKNSHEEELLCMQIIEEGVLAIAGGSNPRYIQEKLEFMLPKSQHTEQK